MANKQELIDNPLGYQEINLKVKIQNHQVLMMIKALELVAPKANINQVLFDAMSRIITEKINEIYPTLPTKAKKAKAKDHSKTKDLDMVAYMKARWAEGGDLRIAANEKKAAKEAKTKSRVEK